MKKMMWITVGVLVLAGLSSFAYYKNYKKELAADVQACKALKPSDAAEAVINNVLRPDNELFSKYHLARIDITVYTDQISISSTSALVPFSISMEPGVRHFGMPRCASLTDVEYAN